MKRFRSLFALVAVGLAACAIAVCNAFVVTRNAITDVCLDVKRRAADIVLAGLELAAQPQLVFRPAVMLERARAFQVRLAKRDRPEITGSWRMCPST